LQSTDLYRRWARASSGDERDVAREHRDILDAVLQRDVERACELLRHHYEETARIVLAVGLVSGLGLRCASTLSASCVEHLPDDRAGGVERRRARRVADLFDVDAFGRPVMQSA